MEPNNQINAPTSSTGWTSFTTTISAVTTSPTTGTILNNTSSYLQMGKMLFVKYFFNQSGAGTAGSGIYLFNIPSGFTINTTVVPAVNAKIPNLGSASSVSVGNGIGIPYVYDSTHYALFLNGTATTQINPVSDVWFNLTTSVSYAVNLRIPIL